MDKIKLIINTDLGDDVDDMVAIVLALHSPELEILGITTAFKNCSLRAQMVKDLLALYGREDIPVYIGQGMSLIERVDLTEEPLQYQLLKHQYEVETEIDAVDFIINTVREYPEVCFVEMATQTNLGLAFLKAPEIMKKVKIIGMGGAYLNTFPEWNIKWDPEAARIVMDFASNLTMFGLDVTKYCKLSSDELTQVENSKLAEVQYIAAGMRIFAEKTGYPITLHDAICIAYLIDPSIATLKKGNYSVELRGEKTRGTIIHNINYYEVDEAKEIVEQEDKNFTYAIQIDVQKFRKLIMDRVFYQSTRD